MSHTVRAVVVLSLGLACTGRASAAEGQWPAWQIDALATEMQTAGLRIEGRELWDGPGKGIMAAVVNLSGCSGAFVSAEGLIATNHHCAQRALQKLSSPEHDYLELGFYAEEGRNELPVAGKSVLMLRAIEDVTDAMQDALAMPDPAQRMRAIKRKEQELTDACEEAPNTKCSVAMFYGGERFRRFTYDEIDDVRLVYAPPRAIGNYGGDIDNWQWPRHTGDFTLFRAYVDDKPFAPERFLETSTEGAQEGDFVAVLGFPGRTRRHLPAKEIKRFENQYFPLRSQFYGELIAALDKIDEDPKRRIKAAATRRSLGNRKKNADGSISGLRSGRFAAKRAQQEKEHAQTDDDFARALEQLGDISDKRRESFRESFLLSNAKYAANSLEIAIELVRWIDAAEQSDPPEKYAPGKRDEVWERIDRAQNDFDAVTDGLTLPLWLKYMSRVSEIWRERIDKTRGAERLLRSASNLADETVKQAFESRSLPKALRRNELVRLATEVAGALARDEATGKALDGESVLATPVYEQGLATLGAKLRYPDANGTLRISYAHVRGYAPREGLIATPHTTLQGQIAKHTGVAPFDLPKNVIDAASRASQSRFADPESGAIASCFLSDADTTGGNSGSAVIDGSGRWIGLNFDRVWENVVGDFGYRPTKSRNVVADVRYLLWTLHDVVGDRRLLQELGVNLEDLDAELSRDQPEGPGRGKGVLAPALVQPEPKESTPVSACRVGDGQALQPGFIALTLVGVWLRRRRDARKRPALR